MKEDARSAPLPDTSGPRSLPRAAATAMVGPRRGASLAEEMSDELLEIKREIVESRGLVIKTNNLTSALAADLKAITKRQAAADKRAFWNSAGAMGLFVLVVIAVVALAWDARMDSVEAKTKGAQEKITALEEEKKAARQKAEERAAAESAAAAFYEVIRSERQKDIIDGFEAIRKQPLSRAELLFFQDAVDKAKSELSVKAYQQGLDHMRTGRWHDAALAFEEAVSRKGSGAHIPSAKLNLARAYEKLNRQRDAIPILMPLSEASPDPEIMDDATFLLAQCFIEIQAYNDAKSTLRAFVRRFPDSPLLNDARMALADLSIKH
ncbi:MAG: tetratricopeptide repeat protein [Polyangiaceae bacterium]